MHKRKISNEDKLIFLCTRLKINDFARQEIRKFVLSSSIDWNKIIEISHRHEILPILYYNFNKLNLQDIISQDIFAAMQNCYYVNLNKNLMFEKELSLILELTNREGMSIIPFRGFTLIQTLYQNPGLRIIVDIDILIKENEFQKIRNILNQLGYQENAEEASGGHFKKYQFETVFSKTLSLNLPLHIEIHRAFAPARPYKINLPYLWKRTQEKSINNQKLLCLSPEDTFLSLALHLKRHTRRLILKFIVDIAELLNTNGDKLDWPYIKKSAKNNHIVTPIYFSLYIARELLKAPISPKILIEFRPSIIKSTLIYFFINKYNFFTLKKWQGHFLRLLLFDSPIDFFLYLWRVSFLEKFIAGGNFCKILTTRIIKKWINMNADEITKK